MSLPPNLILAKNSLNCEYPWILLLEFTINPEDENPITHRFARNYEDIQFKGETYKAFNFQVGLIEENVEGKIPTTTVAVSNVTQYLQPALEEYEGCLDASVRIIVVHADLLSEDYSELELEFDVLSPVINANVVSFQLGAPSPLRQRHPLYRYLKDLCPFKFKGILCGYSEEEFNDCNHRFCDCKERENQSRFGGFPGLT